jgi:stage V sporulation protein B
MNENNQKGGIMVQASILASASIIVRIIGILYRSPLTAIIGDEGNGYYGFAYNIYAIVLMVSSYSIPQAISKLMAQKMAIGEYRNAQRIFRCTLAYAVVVGVLSSILLFFGAGLLVPPSAVPVLRMFAPTIFFFAILGVLRGYFQADQNMTPTSVSQILEQIANAVVSIGAAWLFINYLAGSDPHNQAVYGAMGSALGTGSGVFAALIFMSVLYFASRKRFRRRIRHDRTRRLDPWPVILRDTILVITPFILSGFILNLTTTVNQTIYYNIMAGVKGMDEFEMSTAYGIFSNKAVVISNIPISIATAMATAVIPNISAAYAMFDLEETRRRFITAVRFVLVVAVPCAAGLCVLAKPVTMLLFPQWDSLDLASRLLAMLSVTVVLYSVSTITNAALQSIGRMSMPLVSAGIALIAQTVILVLLLFFTDLGVYALVAVSIIYSGMIFALNQFFLQRYLDPRADLVNVLGKPCLAALVMSIACRLVYSLIMVLCGALGLGRYSSNLICLAPSILIAVIVYFFVLIRIGTLSREDILNFPRGRLLLKTFRRLGWMK